MKKDKISLEKYGLVISLVGVTLLFAILTQGKLFTPINVSNVFLQNAHVIVLSIGMYFCLSTRNVDLSVGSVVAFSGALLGNLTVLGSYSLGTAIVVVIIFGIFIGFIQGSIIAFLGVPAFICTLAMELILRGFTVVLLDSRTLGPFDERLRYIASGYILPNFKIAGLNVICIIIFFAFSVAIIYNEFRKIKRKKQYNFDVPSTSAIIVKLASVIFGLLFIMYSLARANGMSITMVILIVLMLIYSYIASDTSFGRKVFAVGANRKAARLSGVLDKKIILAVYVNSAILASIAGLLVAGRLNAATAIAGTGYELEAISAVSISGGPTAGIFSTFIGASVMSILNNGMSVLGLGQDIQKIVKGIIVVLAVGFDVFSKSRGQANGLRNKK